MIPKSFQSRRIMHDGELNVPCTGLTRAISNSNHKARGVIRPTNQELVNSEDATEPRPLFEMVWPDRNAVMKTDWQNKLTWDHHQNIWRTKMSSKPAWIPIWIRNDVPLQVIKREMQISEATFFVLYPDKRCLYFIDCYFSFNYSSLWIDLQGHHSTNS